MRGKELREKLSKLDDETNIVVYWEEGSEHQYFGIDDVRWRGALRREMTVSQDSSLTQRIQRLGFLFTSLQSEFRYRAGGWIMLAPQVR